MTRTDAGPDFGSLFSTLATLTTPVQSRLHGRTSYEPGPRRTLRRAVEVLLTWSERTRQRRQLMQFDDHLLRDIGITRVEAIAEAKKPFWRA